MQIPTRVSTFVSESSSVVESSGTATALSLAGIVITAGIALLTAWMQRKGRRERDSDRRKIEEETTEVILKRVRAELDRAYRVIDLKDSKLRTYSRFFYDNRSALADMNLRVPDVDIDEGPLLREQMAQVRVEIDKAADDERESCTP